MKVVLVEDNASVRNTLKVFLDDLFPDLHLVGLAPDIKQGIQLIRSEHPDLVFLDVELPDGEGFELLKQLQPISFQVIFITAHEKYALKAIKHSAIDFLLKPIDEDELIASIEKAKRELEKDFSSKRIEALFRNIDHGNGAENIVVSDKYGLQIIKVKEIIRLEGEGNYTKIYLTKNNPIVTSKGLKEYEQLLKEERFFRCHQSHMINLDFLERYDKREGDILLLNDGARVPLAKRKKEALLKIISS